MKNYNTLLQFALRAAIEAGRHILDIYNDPHADFRIEYKADASPLTRADKAAHKTIVNILTPAGFPILSEEGAKIDYDLRRDWGTLWIVDPLDGTKEFIKRNGEFTVNIALVDKGTPVLGVIYVPVLDTLYFAADGLGAFKLKDTQQVSLDDNIEAWIKKAQKLPLELPARNSFVVVASRSHLNPETEAYIDSLRRIHSKIDTVSSGSSIKICLVAEGQADLYPRFAPTMEWDTAAGHAIAKNAGCEIVQAQNSTPLTYNKEDLHNPEFIVEPIQANWP